ncbi:MAG: photosynthesis system II assembly factor Ycf48 [Oscillatoriales cyanobacterium SM2_2_1]|nr:photosynthesis system II assembly factor Ycf48 [Oscillatoriales cyanobacterium SM2_2_1]
MRHQSLRFFWRPVVLFLLCVFLGVIPFCTPVWAANWQKVALPTAATPLELWMEGDHGWLVGSNATLLETVDGGRTWNPHKINLGEGNYRFESISFTGQEGWLVGKPALLLHTDDGGETWTRIGLSSKLPGDPVLIRALGPNTAEMSTDIGAIYRTGDRGQNWRALVTQAVGTARNLYRSSDGRYIAISAKGNFYSTWAPGEVAWTQHNRNNSKRVNNMGYTPDGRVWMLNRGGQLQFTKASGLEEWEKPVAPKAAKGIGFLDLAYQDEQNIWVAGGNSLLMHSEDGGKTWRREADELEIGANLYRIYFFGRDRGFILGQGGTLLRYGT